MIAPIAPSDDGSTYNINADTVAGAIAVAANATRLLLLTDIVGVLDKSGNLIKEMSVADAHDRILHMRGNHRQVISIQRAQFQ